MVTTIPRLARATTTTLVRPLLDHPASIERSVDASQPSRVAIGHHAGHEPLSPQTPQRWMEPIGALR